MLDAELKSDEHVSTKVEKANSMVGLIGGSFSYPDSFVFRKLFTTFVNVYLKYGQVI